MSAVDHSIWDELIRRVECLEIANARLTEELRALQDRVYQPYRTRPAEPWPPENDQ